MSWTSGNRYLTAAEMAGNAQEFAQYGIRHGWTQNAIAGMLGNMQEESGINPGIWENLTPFGTGYGLTQWTPYTKYTDWATAQGYVWMDNGPAEMARIAYEVANNQQWFRNDELGIDPPVTFYQYMTDTTLSLQDCSNYFLWFYEHPTDPGPATQAVRYANAQYWLANINWNITTVPAWLLFKFKDRRRS